MGEYVENDPPSRKFIFTTNSPGRRNRLRRNHRQKARKNDGVGQTLGAQVYLRRFYNSHRGFQETLQNLNYNGPIYLEN